MAPHSPGTPGYTFEALSHTVLGTCIDVRRQLGPHCMEVDYQRALELALPKHGLQLQRELEVPVVNVAVCQEFIRGLDTAYVFGDSKIRLHVEVLDAQGSCPGVGHTFPSLFKRQGARLAASSYAARRKRARPRALYAWRRARQGPRKA